MRSSPASAGRCSRSTDSQTRFEELRPGIIFQRRVGIFVRRQEYSHRDAVVVLIAIAFSLAGTIADAVGQPVATQESSGESPAPAGPSAERLCNELASTALQNDLPAQFFARLIWQESRFNTSSVSRAGAQGIAQFMPATARSRKLADPFEPIQALHEAARLLKELRTEFGNLGLAAAAYNAGPRRVREWLAGLGHLPGETRAYVQTITGRTVEDWGKARSGDDATAAADSNPCSETAGLLSGTPAHRAASVAPAVGQTVSAVWALQLIGDLSEGRAISAYRALQRRFPTILGNRDPLVLRNSAKGSPWYRVRVAETSLQRANELCARLQSAGGTCLVQRNQ